MNQRIEWIDTLKGVGIILVILGHGPLPEHLKTYIYTFHMPMFFFISGFLYSKKPNSVVSKKAKGLLIPYFWFSVFSILILYFRSFYGEHTNSLNFENLFDLFILSKGTTIFYNPALWFLTCLFLVEIFFDFLNKKIINKYFLVAIILILYFLSSIIFGYKPLAWSIDDVAYYTIMFGLGYHTKMHNILMNNYLVFSLACLNILVYIDPYYGTSINFINEIIKLIKPITGIALFIIISRLIQNIGWLRYIGKNSLSYFALHLPVGFYIYDKLSYYLSLTFQSNVESILLTIFTLIILTPFVILINKKAPFIIGKNNKKGFS